MSTKQDPTEELIPVWQEVFKIPAEDIDFKGKLKFHSLCRYFFELASQHANHLHFGYQDLKQANYYWVLSRLHVKVNRYPGFDQRIIINTWHKGVNRLFGLRDFRILDTDNHELVLATSAWLVIDKKTGRPVRPDVFTETSKSKTDHHAIKEIPDKIDPIADHETEKLIDPGYTDFDINQHVNAGRYIEWIQDLYTPEFYKNYQISEFRINYLNETRFDEKIRIYSRKESIQNSVFSMVEGRISSTDTPAFRASICWTKN
jgi:medium-chain acyl-[acyl-carrier-protein] hydrolase